MAVFGAPIAIAEKERAAVQAGCAILEAMESMRPESSNPGVHLSVGVGIATGTDFVGTVRAGRTIWTALGNTTNLASRLQELTRELHVAMVIDAATRAALDPCTITFEQRRVAIRGRSEEQDVHLLQQRLENRTAGSHSDAAPKWSAAVFSPVHETSGVLPDVGPLPRSHNHGEHVWRFELRRTFGFVLGVFTRATRRARRPKSWCFEPFRIDKIRGPDVIPTSERTRVTTNTASAA